MNKEIHSIHIQREGEYIEEEAEKKEKKKREKRRQPIENFQ